MSRFLTAAFSVLVLTAATVSAQDPPVPPPLPPGPGGFDGGFAPVRPAAQQFKELVPTLINTLGDGDAEVRQHAAAALAALGKDAVPALVEALKDNQKERRAGAAYALGQMGFFGRDAIPGLLTALKDGEATVKRSAAHALSRILSQEGGSFHFGYGPPGMPVGPGRPFTVPGVAPTPPPLTPLPVPPKPDRDVDAKEAGKR